jgi:hypothetical protein
MGNSTWNDCVVACFGYTIAAWTSLAKGEPLFLDNAVIDAYRAITGFNGASDGPGMTTQTGLDYWVQKGIGGHRLIGYIKLFSD